MPAQDSSAADPAAAVQRLLVRAPVRVRWRDLDPFNHVNNANFLTFIEEARLVWLTGIDGEWAGAHFAPVLAATQVNYRRQLTWPSEVVVELSAARVGTTSLTITHRIVAAEDAELLYSDGSVVMVWTDPANGTAVPLPAAVRRACA